MERTRPWLAEPKKTIEILQKYQFRFQKRFGQNFLIDPHVLDKIVAAADIREEDFVIEIGPGIGTLTQYLAWKAGKVCAIEIDRNLFPILKDTLSEWDNITIVEGDVMKLDLHELIREKAEGRPVKIVANLPYYITTPILMSIFERHLPVTSVTVMVQKEVAERMQAKPGTKDYGALSVAVQYYALPYIAAYVPQNCFMPRPNVGSAVIRLEKKETQQAVQDEELMFALVKAAFGQRRKTLANALKNAPELQFGKEEISKALSECDLVETVRGETLDLTQFAALADAFGKLVH